MKPLHWLMLLSLASLGASFSVRACSYDGQFNNPFTESFPGSLDVAIATQEALELKQLETIDELKGQQGLRRASWWLKLLVKQHNSELKSVAYIYLVDSHLWSRMTIDSSVDIHSSPTSLDQKSVLLLSEATLSALVQNKVDFKSAIELGIMKFSS
ncbi:hypothetical protein [Photobacterium sp. OFAV2-7]|uniref:hypothetical protein n=1 Tax=Photobacterium sp. OFAV2-7 TaxID=2917748 RepID=UPI001EF5BCF4|nr:hypothetical protein [Photobacterium sp. OFAV2-7]MCG7587564.1 hypothetical protein [Photobacterium sp. OFAV2-7]